MFSQACCRNTRPSDWSDKGQVEKFLLPQQLIHLCNCMFDAAVCWSNISNYYFTWIPDRWADFWADFRVKQTQIWIKRMIKSLHKQYKPEKTKKISESGKKLALFYFQVTSFTFIFHVHLIFSPEDTWKKNPALSEVAVHFVWMYPLHISAQVINPP